MKPASEIVTMLLTIIGQLSISTPYASQPMRPTTNTMYMPSDTPSAFRRL
jgi:hypothetical protein